MRCTAIFAATLATLLTLAACAGSGMARDCAQLGDWNLMIKGCTAMIDSGKYSGQDLVALYNNRAGAYDELGEHARAIEDYDEALRLNPDNAPSYYNRGNVYRDLGEPWRAIEDYDQALRRDPGYLDAYNNRGVVYANLGEHSRAIDDYDQALRLSADDLEGYHNRANSRCSLRQVEASLDDRMRILRLSEGARYAEDMQRHLRDRGFYKGAINGTFDLATQKALREWTEAGCPWPNE